MKPRRLLILPLLCAVGLAAAGGSGHAQAPPPGDPPADAPFRPDRILAKPRADVTEADLAQVHEALGAESLKTFKDLDNLQVVKIPQGMTVEEALAQYRDSGLVEYAEPDYLLSLGLSPNDPRLADGSLWGLHNTGQSGGTNDADIDAPEGWETLNAAPNVVVAVIDTGIRYTHEDLAANMWHNPGEIPGNGVDDDGNGYVDDVFGINAITNTGNPMDDNGHGTHVSGTIGAVGNNGKGSVGVAWQVQLMACKFLSSGGSGYTSDAIKCVDYARSKGARIMSNSWGGGGYSQGLADAIAAARNAGMLFVAAAGNSASNNDLFPFYPASYNLDNVVSVASTTRTDALSSFSSFGPTMVDLAAPGSEIYSTWNTSDSAYNTISGTSMATPHVSGVFALMAARFPGETYLQLIDRVYHNVDQLPSLAGKCVTEGRVNLDKALRSLPAPGPTLSVGDVTLVEGNAGSASAVFTVSLSPSSTQTVTVSYATANGTATAGSDYTAASGALTFAPGITTQAVAVAVSGDGLNEGDETFFLDLSGPVNANVGDGRGQATISNDDAVPTLSIADVTVMEGNYGTTNAVFTVTRSPGSGQTVTVNYATANGSATAGTASGSNPATISIPDVGKAAPYPSTLTVPASGTVTKATVTLNGFGHTWPEDVDVLLVGPAGQTVMLMADVGGSAAISNITLTFDDAGPALGTGPLVSGTYRPTNLTDVYGDDLLPAPAPSGPYGTALSAFNGLPAAGTWSLYVRDDFPSDFGSFSGGWSLTLETTSGDYTAAAGLLTFPPSAGPQTQTITVTVNGDVLAEPDETFFVNLTGATNATIADSQAVGTILNDGDTAQEVFWTHVVGATASGNDLTKTAPDGWDNAGAVSRQALAVGDGFVEFTAEIVKGYGMAGLSQGDTNQSYTDIDYAILPLTQNRLFIYEKGINRFIGTYQPGDRVRVAVESGVVRYRRNGTLVYQSSMPPVFPLLVDSSIYSSGATIADAVISGTFVPPQPPVANPGGPYTVGTGSVLQLDGSGSFDSDGAIVGYAWSFGDGTTGGGVSPTHIYAVAGSYTVTLTVTDNDGLTHTATTTVLVEAVEEVVWTHVVGATPSGNDLTKTASDGWGNAGAISKRSLTGDGFVEFTAEAGAFWMAGLSHGDSNQMDNDIDFALYPLSQNRLMVYEAGLYRVTDTYAPGDRLRVSVESGTVRYRRNGTLIYQSTSAAVFPLVLDSSIYRSGTTIKDAVISGTFLPPQAPVANPGGPYTGGTGLPVQLDGSGSSDADGSIVSYGWSFGDGTTGDGAMPTHVYGAAGAYTVSLTVTDNDGLTHTATTGVLVEAVEEIAWTHVVGATATGNDLTKTAPDGWGNAGAISKRSLAGDGFVEFTAEAGAFWIAGLSHGDSNQMDDDIDFALYPLTYNRLMVYESGMFRFIDSYSAGDRLRVSVESGVVRYRRNGALIYQSTVAPVYPLVLDSSIYRSGTTVKDAVISGSFPAPGPPIANPGGPYTAGTGLTLQLDGGGSSDPDGVVVAYEWSFGDGTTGSGVSPTHIYAVAGSYTLSLTVTDNDGLTHTATTTVLVEAVEEVVWTHVVGATAAGNDLKKDAPDGWGNAGAISTRSLVGDGFVEFTAEAGAFWIAGLSHGDSNQMDDDIDFALYPLTYNRLMVYEAGIYRITDAYAPGDRLRVSVESGVVRYRRNGALIYQSTVAPVYPLVLDSSIYRSGTTVKDAVISGSFPAPGPPIANPGGPYTAGTGVTLQLNGGGSSDPDGVVVAYEWSFGDGGAGSGVSPTHVYAVAGSYTVSLTVTDNDGLTHTATTTVLVEAVEEVIWTHVVGATAAGNDLTKTAPDGWGNAGGISTRSLVGDGFVEFTAEAGAFWIAGLSHGDSNQLDNDVDFALYPLTQNRLMVYEAGMYRVTDSYAPGDRLRVSVESGVVRYRRNGVLIYQSTVAPVYPLGLDSSIYRLGSTIKDAVLSGALQ